MLDMEEETWYYLTNLEVEDNFGFKLQTGLSSGYQRSNKDEVIPVPDVAPYNARIGYTDPNLTIVIPSFAGVSIDITLSCTKQHCAGQVIQSDEDPDMGVCDKCKRDCVITRCKKIISGEVDTDNVTLNLNAEAIDSYYGQGASATFHKENIRELKKKILLLENIKVKYNGKSKFIISITQT